MKRLQRKRRATAGVRTGTLTVCLLIISIVLAIVAVLALQTAKSNLVHADAFVETTEHYYANDAAAQEMLAAIGTSDLERAQAQGAIPAEAEVDGDVVRVLFMDGTAHAPSGLATDVVMDNGGIATSGLNDEDKTSSPALLVELDFSARGEQGTAYRIASWSQTRVYA